MKISCLAAPLLLLATAFVAPVWATVIVPSTGRRLGGLGGERRTTKKKYPHPRPLPPYQDIDIDINYCGIEFIGNGTGTGWEYLELDFLFVVEADCACPGFGVYLGGKPNGNGNGFDLYFGKTLHKPPELVVEGDPFDPTDPKTECSDTEDETYNIELSVGTIIVLANPVQDSITPDLARKYRLPYSPPYLIVTNDKGSSDGQAQKRQLGTGDCTFDDSTGVEIWDCEGETNFFIDGTVTDVCNALDGLVGECEYGCHKDSDCGFGLVCANGRNKRELKKCGLNKKKAYCPGKGKGKGYGYGYGKGKVCYNPITATGLCK